MNDLFNSSVYSVHSFFCLLYICLFLRIHMRYDCSVLFWFCFPFPFAEEMKQRSWYSGYVTGGMVQGLNPGTCKRFFSSPTHPHIQWYWGSFPQLKWPGRAINNSPPSQPRGKEGVELYPICLHGMDKENFTFHLSLCRGWYEVTSQ